MTATDMTQDMDEEHVEIQTQDEYYGLPGPTWRIPKREWEERKRRAKRNWIVGLCAAAVMLAIGRWYVLNYSRGYVFIRQLEVSPAGAVPRLAVNIELWVQGEAMERYLEQKRGGLGCLLREFFLDPKQCGDRVNSVLAYLSARRLGLVEGPSDFSWYALWAAQGGRWEEDQWQRLNERLCGFLNARLLHVRGSVLGVNVLDQDTWGWRTVPP